VQERESRGRYSGCRGAILMVASLRADETGGAPDGSGGHAAILRARRVLPIAVPTAGGRMQVPTAGVG